MTQHSMVIGCLQLTDVTHYKVLYDSYGRRKKFGGGLLVRNVEARGIILNLF